MSTICRQWTVTTTTRSLKVTLKLLEKTNTILQASVMRVGISAIITVENHVQWTWFLLDHFKKKLGNFLLQLDMCEIAYRGLG